MPHYVYGVYDGATLWAYLHDGRIAWTDCKADAQQWTARQAEIVRAQAPRWLTQVKVGTLMNYLGISRGIA